MSETTEMVLLSTTEQQDLARCESIVARGMQTFIEVGNALAEIREQRLYRASHATFADYCQERWQMSRPRVYQLMEAAEVAGDLSTIVDKSEDVPESHLRPLSALDSPDQRRAAWSRATDLAGSGKRTAKHVEQAVQEQRLPPLDAPGLALLKALGWRLDARIPPDKYRVLPPETGGKAEVLTDAECLERSRRVPLVRLPEDFQEMQELLGDVGYLAMDGRTGEFRIVTSGGAETFSEWWRVQARIRMLSDLPASGFVQQIEDAAAVTAPEDDWGAEAKDIATYEAEKVAQKMYAPPADFTFVQGRLGGRGALSLDTATGVFCVAAPGEESVFFRDGDFHLRWRLTKEHCARLRNRLDPPGPAEPEPMPDDLRSELSRLGWELQSSRVTANLGTLYKLACDGGRGGTEERGLDGWLAMRDDLLADEQRMIVVKARGFIAEKKFDQAYQMINRLNDAKRAEIRKEIDRAIDANFATRAKSVADDGPHLPADFDALGQRLAGIGWVGVMPDGEFTLRHVDTTEYIFDTDQWDAVCQQAEAWIAARVAPVEPDATAEQREVLTAWLTEYLCILRGPVQRMLAQTLVPASTQPWTDATTTIRAAMAAKIVASLDETMLHQCMGREGVGR